MFYEFAVTTPANTTKAAPLITRIAFVAGVITAVAVQFPRGCVGLVHAAVRHATFQIWPTNSDGDISGDNAIIDFAEHYVVDSEPYDVQLVTWNLDDTFAHTVTFRFSELRADLAAQQQSALNALLYLDKWFSSQQPVGQGSA